MVIFEEIQKAFPAADEIVVLRDGQKSGYPRGGKQYEEIMAVWQATLAGSRQMPAFGVSIDALTVKEMTAGVWIEFVYGEQCECWGMTFDRLAVSVNAAFSGFNVIRHSDGLYQGRCYYIDLVGRNMSEVYDCLKALKN